MADHLRCSSIWYASIQSVIHPQKSVHSLIDNQTVKHIQISTYLYLRKEVIQPHLPIRLPCYDFTPIISSTFDGWLLAVTSPASGVSDSHSVTGGVYKARERIHRGMLTRDY